ncbi:hypothetical protein J2N67_006352 (plasmid) [Bacillus thuringiensis]|nr:hypothetical protein J2N67_006352 [Bacillus thuringiensis]
MADIEIKMINMKIVIFVELGFLGGGVKVSYSCKYSYESHSDNK